MTSRYYGTKILDHNNREPNYDGDGNENGKRALQCDTKICGF